MIRIDGHLMSHLGPPKWILGAVCHQRAPPLVRGVDVVAILGDIGVANRVCAMTPCAFSTAGEQRIGRVRQAVVRTQKGPAAPGGAGCPWSCATKPSSAPAAAAEVGDGAAKLPAAAFAALCFAAHSPAFCSSSLLAMGTHGGDRKDPQPLWLHGPTAAALFQIRTD